MHIPQLLPLDYIDTCHNLKLDAAEMVYTISHDIITCVSCTMQAYCVSFTLIPDDGSYRHANQSVYHSIVKYGWTERQNIRMLQWRLLPMLLILEWQQVDNNVTGVTVQIDNNVTGVTVQIDNNVTGVTASWQ